MSIYGAKRKEAEEVKGSLVGHEALNYNLKLTVDIIALKIKRDKKVLCILRVISNLLLDKIRKY